MTAVKLFLGLICSPQINLETIYQQIEAIYGPIEMQSDCFDFSHTTYYEAEMGNKLKKQFLAIKTLISPYSAYTSKEKSIALEAKYSLNQKRLINIDPGILSAHNVILFSTKNYAHRIPLKNKMFAELTYVYQHKKYITLPWTYPDFEKEHYLNYFTKLRKHYLKQCEELM